MTIPEILRRATEEVRKGWVKGIRHDASGDVCALGAIENALRGTRQRGMNYCPYARMEFIHAAEALAQLIPQDTRGTEIAIATWNNAPDQTAENVAATMELAAICFEQARAIEETLAAVDPSIQPQESVPRA